MAREGLTLTEVTALEILDSRGNPTVQVTLKVDGEPPYVAGVPSGASTGSREAVELRDGDENRYAGKGVTHAVNNVNGEIADVLRRRTWTSLAEIDEIMIALDGTSNKGRLGANALVGVSMAAARAFAAEAPLWQYLQPADVSARMPVPHFNVLNGGAHAANNLDFQEFMIAPIGAPNFPEAVRAGAAIYARLRALLQAGGEATGLGDEGGFAPNIAKPEDVLALIVQAIVDAGYPTGKAGVAIALDPASSEFYHEGNYHVAGESLTTDDMISRYEQIAADFPVWLIEDGLAESDWDGWERLTARLGDRLELVGDDIFVTNPAIITEAIARKVGNAALIKVNQIGTITETLEAQWICREAGYAQLVSHRSGETPDTFIADLTVGTGAGHVKTGAPARGERVAKYNRLLEIAAANPQLPYGLPPTSVGLR